MEVRLNQKEFNYKMATGTLNLFLAENKIDPTKPTKRTPLRLKEFAKR